MCDTGGKKEQKDNGERKQGKKIISSNIGTMMERKENNQQRHLTKSKKN